MTVPSTALFPTEGLYPGAPTGFGDILFATLEPWQTDDLQLYCRAIGAMFDPLMAVIQDTGTDGDSGYVPGYGVLFDIDTCPTADLSYLGQFVGVQLPTSVDDATARALIRAEAGINRGTVASILSAVQRNLTGTQSVVLRERTDGNGNPDAYQMLVAIQASDLHSTWAAETSSWSQDAFSWQSTSATLDSIKSAVNSVKPAGILVNYVISSGNTWASATHQWSQDTFSWAAAFNTQP